MEKISKVKVGLVLGIFVGAVHLIWSALVGLGWAQGLCDWIFKMHMIQNPHIINDFSWGIAIGLIVVTFIVGFVVGFALVALWNGMKK